MNIDAVVLGSDANAYHMARSFHEAYDKKAYCIIKSPLAFTENSEIIHYIREPNLWDEEVFLKTLRDFAQSSDSKKLLISSNEIYASYIMKNAEELGQHYYFNYPDLDTLDTLIYKDKFYETYKDSDIDLPKTIIYPSHSGQEVEIDFEYPVIVKPADVIEYGEHKTADMFKIYKVNSLDEAKTAIKEIEDCGYKANIIIQEFIPGDDSALFDSVIYVSKPGKSELISFAQIGLQEHGKTAIGNATVLINGYSQYGDYDDVLARLAKFMEDIGYRGWAEFDLKYDVRDGKYKVLEINARQGRSSYYVTACGYNLAKVFVDDCILGEVRDLTYIKEEQLLSFVPKGIIKKYINNEEFRKKALSLYPQRVSPIEYDKDMNLKRRLFLARFKYQYFEKYKNGDWKN